MADPLFSPDGKWMWSGSEWIPAPPGQGGQQLNMQDSVIGGDVVHNTVVNNDPAAVTTAVIAALQQMGMVNPPPATPAAPPPALEVELPAAFNVGDHVEYHSPTTLDGWTAARSWASTMMEPTELKSPTKTPSCKQSTLLSSVHPPVPFDRRVHRSRLETGCSLIGNGTVITILVELPRSMKITRS